MANQQRLPRKNISLTGDTINLLEKLTQVVSNRMKEPVSQAYVVKLALRELEQIELTK